jgi:putative flippase GtrA
MIDFPQTFRYSVVSGLCLLLSVALIPLLVWWGLHYALATFAAFCLVAVLGFSLHSLWTFRVEYKLSSFIRYVSAIAINLPLGILLIAITHDLIGLSISTSSAVSWAALIVWNYLAARWAVLSQKLEHDRESAG